jgi:radical SAM superfamily enzyme with C-terminal helix-hairpin-helix motif
MEALNRIMEEGLLLRRINIRQVVILPGTYISENGGAKFWHKNKKYYWKWRNEIRQKIDWPMLKKIVPSGTVLEEVYAEIYDGKTTFCRQMGTYPLIVGVKGRLELGKKYKIKVVGQMLRSITGEVVS